MKQSSRVLQLLFLLLSTFNVYADDVDCSNYGNYFKMDEDPRGCIYDNKIIKNPLFDLTKFLENSTYQSCDLDFKSAKRKNDRIQNCKKVTSCLGKIDSLVKENDKTLYCSITDLKSIYGQAINQKLILKVRAELMKSDSENFKLNHLTSLVSKKVGDLKRNIKSCPSELAETNCLRDIPGLDMSIIYSVVNSDVMSQVNDRIEEIVKKASTAGAGGRVGDKKLSARTATTAANLNSILDAVQLTGMNTNNRLFISPEANAIDNDNEGKAQESNLEQEKRAIEAVEKIAKELGVDVNKIKKTYFNDKGEEHSYRGPESKMHYMVDLANAASDLKCSSTAYNENFICRKVVDEFKKERERDQSGNVIAAKYIGQAKNKDGSKMFPSHNQKLIEKLDTRFGFDFNSYLDLSSQYNVCINNFGKEAFDGKDAEIRFQTHIAQAQQDTDSLRRVSNNRANQSAKSIAIKLNDSDDEKVRESGKRLFDLSSSVTGNNESFDRKIDDKILGRLNNSQSSDLTKLANTIQNGNLPHADEGSFVNDFKSAFNQYAKTPAVANNTATPVVNTNNADYSPIDSLNNSNSTQAILKRLAELEEKEKALRKKADDKMATADESEETKLLRQQIDELKSQLSKKDATDVLGNKIVGAKELVPTSANSISSSANNNAAKFPTASNSSSALINSKRENNEGQNDVESGNVARSNFQEASSAFQDIRSPAAVGGAKAIAGSSRSSGSSSFGLALTRNGDITEDLSKIVDNPKDSDLIVLAEKSNGRPFIIRENGLLVQVVIEKDADGKAIMENGKPKLKKIKLSKEKEAVVVREFNIVREAKTVRDTVRLQELRKTTEDAVK